MKTNHNSAQQKKIADKDRLKRSGKATGVNESHRLTSPESRKSIFPKHSDSGDELGTDVSNPNK